MTNKEYINDAIKTGMSPKAATVYVTLLKSGLPLSPKRIILLSNLHRQYVYDGLHELEESKLLIRTGNSKRVRYQAVDPNTMLQAIEKQRIDTLSGISSLQKLYNHSPAGVVEIIRGSENCIVSEFKLLQEAKQNDYLDIIGGAGMNFVKLFAEHIEEWELLRARKNIKIRYIGGQEDVHYNQQKSQIKNDSRFISDIGNIVNVCIRPESVSFNIYDPEIVTIRVRNTEAVKSQKMLFEILWQVAKQ